MLERKPWAYAEVSQGDTQQVSPLRTTVPALRCRSGEHSRRRCRAPPLRGHCCLGVRACGVGDAALPFIFSSSLQRMSSTSEARR